MLGIMDSNGDKNMKGKNKKAAVIAVLPVLPPASIPTADSMKAVPDNLTINSGNHSDRGVVPLRIEKRNE